VCTVILLRRPGHRWPLILGANRDERLDRPWDPPARHWPDRAGVVGGRDRSGGGTWMAMGPRVVAAALNRPGSLGPAPGKLSRGVLPLMAAEAGSAGDAVARLASLDAGSWRPFNLVIADATAAFFLRGLGEGLPEALPLGPGVTMVTAHDPNDPASPRIRRHLPRFREASPPEPETGDWSIWEGLLADGGFGAAGIGEALNVPPAGGFGTVCSSLVALAEDGRRLWRFCPGPPDRAAFAALDLTA
jgi:hypothetical protein